MIKTSGVLAVAVLAAACSSVTPQSVNAGPSSLVGTWRVLDAPAQARVIFTADGEVRGSAACNTFSGRWTMSDSRVRVSDVNATALGCPDADTSLRHLGPLLSVPFADLRTEAGGIVVIQSGRDRLRLQSE